jgi:hypothetical protein
MNIIKPIYVYKWVNSKDYIKYVFDTDTGNAYNTSVNVINEYIFQDSSKEEAINKIAYYINKNSKQHDDKAPYYAWVNNEPFLYDIGVIKWKGYDINPFKSTDRKSEEINETIDKKYSKSKELFDTTEVINIVFKSDFDFDNKYYFDNVRFKSNTYKAASDSKVVELYKLNLVNNQKLSEQYYKVVFGGYIADIPSLIVIFDTLSTTNKIHLIQYINNNINKAYYKLYKKHAFKNRRELNRIFKQNNEGKECINIYYTENIVITIYANGIINLTFNYQINNGVIISDILKYVGEINAYINKVLNIDIVLKEKNINARVKYNAYKTRYDDLKNEIKASTIFTDLKDNGFYYKRTSNYKDRGAVDKKIKDDALINNIKINVKDAADILDTKIMVKKEASGYMVDIKNAKSFFEFENIGFWVSKIIEKTINVKQSTEDDIKSDKQEDDDDDSPVVDIRIQNRYLSSSSETSGGNKEDTKNYLINKLKNADKELWNDNNKSRKCQRVKQPIPLSKEEYIDFEKKGLNKHFDNSIVHNNNYYICPRLWCPKSNVPLDEGNPNAKCPIADETPMRLNDDMKNKNLPRYVYLKKKDNIPCCGKKLIKAANAANKKDDNVDSKTSNKSANAARADSEDDYDKDKNYIMKNYPIYYNKRFGDIPEELYKLLYPDNFKEYLDSCRSPNNINKKRCILRKGLINIDEIPEKYGNRYDNIINTIAYLVDETKETFIENVKNKLDILSYLSLDNGNICKDFGDSEPVLYEYNKDLYGELKRHLYYINKKNKINIELPKFDSKNERAVFKISRLLYIYKSYKKFIEYISSDNYPEDKGIQYLYSLIAFVYKKLLIVWENTINTANIIPSINLIVPEYIDDLITYYGLQKKPEIIMILKEKWKANGNNDDNNKHRDNKLYEIMKDRDNIYFYEPLIIKTINIEKKHMLLSEYPTIKNIVNYHPNNKNKDNIFSNLKYINNLIKDQSLKYSIETIIINDNYTIDKIMLKNNILIRFKPQGTIILPYLMKELNINNVVFLDDIIGDAYNITIVNKVYAKFENKINMLKDFGITLDIGVNNQRTSEIMKNTLTIRGDSGNDHKGQLILFGKKSEFEEYSERNANVIKKWAALRLLVKNKLLALDDLSGLRELRELSKKSRATFIKTLVDMFEGKDNNRSTKKIQIILEEIPIFTKEGINDWYANSLLHTKYDYINELSDKFVDDGNELLFTQYLVKKNIPKNILYYHEANPNIIYDNRDSGVVNYDNIYDDKVDNVNAANAVNAVNAANAKKNSKGSKGSKDSKSNIGLPKMFEGVPKDLNSKWTKYKKKIWWQLKYIKNDYAASNIRELFDYFRTLDNDLVNDYNDIIKKTFKYYKHEFNKNINNLSDNTKIKDIFKDPYFYNAYLNSMNSVNNTKKTFKTLEIFLTTYFYNSSTTERYDILKHLRGSDAYTYHPNEITFFMISKVLNISILIIHHRAEYGKAVNVSKRADDKDLSITTSIYKADNNELERPLLILYKKNDKTHLSYYVVRNVNHNNFIYTELKNAPEEIKTRIINTKNTNTYSSSSSTQTSSI